MGAPNLFFAPGPIYPRYARVPTTHASASFVCMWFVKVWLTYQFTGRSLQFLVYVLYTFAA